MLEKATAHALQLSGTVKYTDLKYGSTNERSDDIAANTAVTTAPSDDGGAMIAAADEQTHQAIQYRTSLMPYFQVNGWANDYLKGMQRRVHDCLWQNYHSFMLGSVVRHAPISYMRSDFFRMTVPRASFGELTNLSLLLLFQVVSW